jgi:hypothetical protein
VARTRRRATWLLLSLLLGAAREARAEDAPHLRFDPFATPLLAGPGVDAEEEEPAAGPPRLRATLVAGENSVAVLDGAVLRLGEEAFGYRLVAVRTWEAVFERAGAQTVIALDDEPSTP